MAFNKSKALDSALKYLNQGKVNQAIAEYQQILRNDPKDQATLMTVGDLFARQGDMGHALEYFERLAQVYLADGFNSKAIAIYKKIAKLAPSEIAPLEKLADLYVQQGVLSEARPLFLQIAETHLKANRPAKAVEVLHRLLEAEPENPRVQMRLAELYNVLGQKGDAAKTYFAYGQRLFDRGETVEAEKLIERALEVVPGEPAALLLKAKILAASGKDLAAIKILEKHPEADAGTEVTNLLVNLEIKSSQTEAAADRARNQLVRGNSHYGLLFRVTETLIEKGEVEEALPLFRELRDPMIEVNEHDKFVKLLTVATERLPENTEALELLADFCRHTSDPFPLNVALTKLADVYEVAGNDSRTEQLLEELVDRNRDDERLQLRLEELRVRMGKKPQPEAETQPLAPQSEGGTVAATPEEAPPASASVPFTEEVLDSITERYVAQALTDVDLFSSYGLTQKAANLLENVLQRAPRHVPSLERLLDLSLGAGKQQRIAELASTLEEIYRNRGDNANADRFAELAKRYQPVTPAVSDRIAAAPPSPSAEANVEPASVGAVPVDLSPVGPEVEQADSSVLEISLDDATAGVPHAETSPADQEVDLSDEWEAMVQEVIEPAAPAIAPVIGQSLDQSPVQSPVQSPIQSQDQSFDQRLQIAPLEQPVTAIPEAEAIDPSQVADSPLASGEPTTFEITEESLDIPSLDFSEVMPAASTSADASAADASAADESFELDLTPEISESEDKEAVTAEQFLSELAAEVDGMEPLPLDEEVASTPETFTSQISASVPRSHVESDLSPAPLEVPEVTTENLNQLAEVFQEFRNEFGELGEEDEDLETHYNLGIAYREMGLLEEAIGEFQKVAKAVQKGKPFRYAMNCATLLALTFRDKGEPKIASLWYRRALDVPGLDQEAIMALRYDLGISLEMANEPDAALDCFRQVYATNIDYRDVADRIATLQHH